MASRSFVLHVWVFCMFVTYVAPAGEYSLIAMVIEVGFGGVKKVCTQCTSLCTCALHWTVPMQRQHGAVTLQSSLKARDRTCSCSLPLRNITFITIIIIVCGSKQFNLLCLCSK